MSIINIDPEFKSLIPPLSDLEYSQLEENILLDGCRDPLVVWGDVLVDGHNRYQICTTHNIDFNIQLVDFRDRDAALDWIDKNQLGRRNLPPDLMSLLRGRIYNRRKKAHGGDRKSEESRDQNDPLISTADTLADEFGVSAPTIKRDGQFAKAVEELKPYVPDIETQIVDGGLAKKAVIDAAKSPETAATTLQTGGHRTIGTGQNEWYTPPEYIEMARAVMGSIDLDPASCEIANKRVMARSIYTIDDNGLDQEWRGNVWLNPPYSQPAIQQFIEKLTQEYISGSISQAILLTHNFTDTRWFHLAADHCSVICFTKGRVKFINETEDKAAPTCGQAFFYFGQNAEKFKDIFSAIGFVVKIYER